METIGLCPLVVNTDPDNMATNVPLNQEVTATFNEAMDPAFIFPESFILTTTGFKSTISMEGNVTYNPSNYQMTFTPSEMLVTGTTYTGIISSGMKDFSGNSLQEPYVWTFSTGSVITPSVISANPGNLASNVPLKSEVRVIFSQPMDASTITDLSFTLKNGTTSVPGSVSYSGTTATFIPASDLLDDNTYVATITTEVQNPTGNSINEDYIWTFNTKKTLGGQMVDLGSVFRRSSGARGCDFCALPACARRRGSIR
jgi:hypothetical protein